MTLPDLSKLMDMARLRYIQTVHEREDCRNPDVEVGHFIPFLRRLRLRWLRAAEVERMRGAPFYYHLIARTLYYDQLVLRALEQGVRQVVNIGCGTDTRAHRFRDSLRRAGAAVLECDQPAVIQAKQQIAARVWPADAVEYLQLDLNAGQWSVLQGKLRAGGTGGVLVMLEGVSPYIDGAAFRGFLEMLGQTLSAGSWVAYDFKRQGVNDGLGREGVVQRPYRLPSDPAEIARFHQELGFQIAAATKGAELRAEFLPALAPGARPVFEEDILVQLRVTGRP